MDWKCQIEQRISIKQNRKSKARTRREVEENRLEQCRISSAKEKKGISPECAGKESNGVG
jgi:hypothetical protein